MRPAPHIGVVVLCGPQAPPALRTLDSLAAAGHRSGALWAVVPEGAPEMGALHRPCSEAGVLAAPFGEGRAGRWNRGLRAALAAGAEYLLLVEAGCELEAGALSRLLIALEAQPKAGAVCPALVGPDGRLVACGGSFNPLTGATAPRLRGADPVGFGERSWECADFAPSACVLFKRELFEDVGLFHDAFGSTGYEAEFGLRAKREYWTVLAVPQARASVPEGAQDRGDALAARERARTPLWLLRAWGRPVRRLVGLPLAALWSWPAASLGHLAAGRVRCALAVVGGSWAGLFGSAWRDGSHLAVPTAGRREKLRIPSAVREMARYF